MTRQREYQLLLISKGICQACAKQPIHPESKCHCIACVIKKRVAGRKSKGCKPKHRTGIGRPTIKRLATTTQEAA